MCVENKQCSKCKELKPLSSFYSSKNHKDGLFPSCIDCEKAYREANKERIAARKKAHREAHAEEYRARRKRYEQANAAKIAERKRVYNKEHGEELRRRNKEWRQANPDRAKATWTKWRRKQKEKAWASWLMILVRRNARRPNGKILSVSIDVPYLEKLFVEQNGLDAYTGTPMIVAHRANNPLSPSVDRIDSSLGYTEGNVCLCCAWVNKAKGAMTAEEFEAILCAAADSIRRRKRSKTLIAEPQLKLCL